MHVSKEENRDSDDAIPRTFDEGSLERSIMAGYKLTKYYVEERERRGKKKADVSLAASSSGSMRLYRWTCMQLTVDLQPATCACPPMHIDGQMGGTARPGPGTPRHGTIRHGTPGHEKTFVPCRAAQRAGLEAQARH